MAAVVIDPIATELHPALGFHWDSPEAIARNAVICYSGELQALKHGNPVVMVGVDGISNDIQSFAAFDI